MPTFVVVGAGGLIGRQVRFRLPDAVLPPPILWQERASVVRAFQELAVSLRHREDAVLIWCAGAGVVGATVADMDAETTYLGDLFAALDRHSVHLAGAVLASSAGAVHGGSQGVVDEQTPVAPVSPYGFGKVDQEVLLRRWSVSSGTPVVLGRLSNVYGPGVRADKPSGIITTVIRRTLGRRPVPLYMPLDTVRDYLYVEDAAAMLVSAARAVPHMTGPRVALLASGRPTTIGQVLADVGRVMRRRPLVAMGTSPLGTQQPRQTVFRPADPLPDEPRATTPLPVGIHRVIRAEMAALYTRGGLGGS